LAEAVQPAIQLAREGFTMYQSLYNSIKNNSQRLKLFESSSKLYLNQTNTDLPICEVG